MTATPTEPLRAAAPGPSTAASSPGSPGSPETLATRMPAVPVDWHGSASEFADCLRVYAAEMLWRAAEQCDALQRGARCPAKAATNAMFDAGVIAATRVVMDLSSVLLEPAGDRAD